MKVETKVNVNQGGGNGKKNGEDGSWSKCKLR